MPPIKIYSTANEKFHRMKENSTTKKEIVKQTNFSLSNLDSYPMSRLSFFKYENLLGIKPMACEGSTLSIVDNNGYLIGGRGVNFKPEIACFNIGNLKLNKKIYFTLKYLQKNKFD